MIAPKTSEETVLSLGSLFRSNMNDAICPDLITAQRAIAKEQDLVEEFLNRYRDSSFRIALRILGNQDSAEDVAQEALIRAFKSWDRLSNVKRQAAWVRKTVVRCALNTVERTPRNEALSEHAPSNNCQTDAVLVQEVLNTLPSEQRVLLGLAMGEELSYREIAEALDIPMGTVASRIHAAKLAFRHAWEGTR